MIESDVKKLESGEGLDEEDEVEVIQKVNKKKAKEETSDEDEEVPVKSTKSKVKSDVKVDEDSKEKTDVKADITKYANYEDGDVLKVKKTVKKIGIDDVAVNNNEEMKEAIAPFVVKLNSTEVKNDTNFEFDLNEFDKIDLNNANAADEAPKTDSGIALNGTDVTGTLNETTKYDTSNEKKDDVELITNDTVSDSSKVEQSEFSSGSGASAFATISIPLIVVSAFAILFHFF